MKPNYLVTFAAILMNIVLSKTVVAIFGQLD